MTMIAKINQNIPNLSQVLQTHTLLNDSNWLWNFFELLIPTHAPSSGSILPGSVGYHVLDMIETFDLSSRLATELKPTGNFGLNFGADKSTIDLLVVSHLDRPTFRVRSLPDKTLFPICADRFPEGEYSCMAKAIRYDGEKLIAGARGLLHSNRQNGQNNLRLEVQEGELQWHDMILMDTQPTRNGDTIIGVGLDNLLGVLINLLTATILCEIETILLEKGYRVLLVFTDQEEAPPHGFFGYGASRLTYLFPPPTLGFITVDGQNTGAPFNAKHGQGVGHGFVSGDGRGAIVPPDLQYMAITLADEINELRPNTVQMNYDYLSRSDDMALHYWGRPLGMLGAPLSNAHTGEETAHLSDVVSGVWWLSYLMMAIVQ